MSLDSDVIVDRRRIRRKLTFWRVAAGLVAIAAIVTVGAIATKSGPAALSGSIARVNIEGLIRSDQQRVEALERLEKSSHVAVIVHINSPGGTTAGSEQLYDSLVRVKAKKPLVVVVEGLAASGGYITAIAADHIGARQTWLVAGRRSKRDLPVREFKLTPQFGDLTFLRTAASVTFDALGLSSIARQIEQAGVAQAVDQLSLNGMLALWRPAATN